ncbi:mechanosensitive ion channel domain-containing protein [Rhodovibrio sodomensis]|nr:mechanosensitive ion channel domain-containing protein [Rhodovibrio sodomensis]
MPRCLARLVSCLLLVAALHALGGGSVLAQAPSPGTTGEPAQTLTPGEAKSLARLLENAESRQALVEKLNAIAAQPTGGQAAGAPAVAEQPAAPAVEPARRSLPRQIAEFTRDAGEGAAAFAVRVLSDLRGLAAIGDGRQIDWGALGQTVLQLAIVVAVTVAVFRLLNAATRVVYARLGRSAGRAGLLGSLALLAGSTVLDAVMILIAWGVGYAIALGVLGTAGRMDIVQTLYLNAFLIIELIKVVLRAVFAPRYADLRILPFSDLNAAYWYSWLSRIVSLLGYGSLVVVPVVNANLGFTTGRSLQVLIALTGLVMAILVILQNRRPVRDGLRRHATERGDMTARVAAQIGRVWHIAALAYVLALFVVWVSRPGDAMTYMLMATGKTIGAVLIGFLVVSAISRAIAGGLHVPDEMRERLPLLEGRLNAFVPNVLRAVRLIVFLFVVGAVLDAWDVADLGGWLASEGGQTFVAALASAAAILFVAWLLWLGMSSWVEYRLNPNVGRAAGARERTLLQLLRNAMTVLLIAIALMLALSEIGVNIGPLLAGAGVLGLAIGFGAQKMVQDVITGAFIQFENAINEGDVVTVAGTTGVVEKLTVRSVGLRDLSGTYHIVPFSAVDTVSNFMRGFAYHVAAIGVAYREDVDEVKQAMRDAFDDLRAGEHGANILDDIEMQGVTEFADSAVTVRARIKTLPGMQWAVGRAYNEVVKRVFDRRGIEIPFPHRTIYWGEDKQGHAPALRVDSDHKAAPGGSLPAASMSES